MHSSPTEDRREFHFTPQDFERIRALIHGHAGICLNQSKQEMVYGRLSRRLRENGLGSFKEYLALLERGNAREWEAFVNSLTTNLTAFFREEHHFRILAEHVAKRKFAHPVYLWCAACSTGEEAYSLAMTMMDVFGSFTPPVRIVATDLDTQVLAKARQGVYALDCVEKLPEATVRRFFHRESDGARVRQELRDMVVFRQLNLLHDSWPIRGPFDAIFCRNVMIYFDKPTQRGILEKFGPLMHQDGLLFCGHSESLYHASDLFRLRGKTVYELGKGCPMKGPAPDNLIGHSGCA